MENTLRIELHISCFGLVAVLVWFDHHVSHVIVPLVETFQCTRYFPFTNSSGARRGFVEGDNWMQSKSIPFWFFTIVQSMNGLYEMISITNPFSGHFARPAMENGPVCPRQF